MVLARNPTPFCHFSLSLLSSSSRETRGAQRERVQRPIKRTSRAARSFRFPSGSCHFFLSLFAFQLTLLLLPPIFCAPVPSRPMPENYLSLRAIGRGHVILFPPFLSTSFTRAGKKKLYARTIVFFSCVFHYSLEDTRYRFRGKGVLLIRALRVAHSLRRVTSPVFPSPV